MEGGFRGEIESVRVSESVKSVGGEGSFVVPGPWAATWIMFRLESGPYTSNEVTGVGRFPVFYECTSPGSGRSVEGRWGVTVVSLPGVMRELVLHQVT